MPSLQPQPVLSQRLVQQFLQFCDATEHKVSCAEQTGLIGCDRTSFAPWFASMQNLGQASHSAVQQPVSQVVNPSFLRASLGQGKQAALTASPELALAREALYNATRVLMRTLPHGKLSNEFFEAACEAWLAQVTEAAEGATYAANREVLLSTKVIWEQKRTLGRINLMGRAQLPPFFDGNSQLKYIFIQSPHEGCDMTALNRLPALSGVSLYTTPKEPIVEVVKRIVPHLTTVEIEEGVLVHLSAPMFVRPKTEDLL